MAPTHSALLLAATGGALAALLVAHAGLTPSWCRRERRGVYVLVVRLKLNPALGGVSAFKAAWAPLAADVRSLETGCLSYELAVREHDENEVIIYERYATKSDLEVVHNAGASFKAFGALLGEGALKGLVLEKSKATYYETNVGFMTR